MVLPSCSLTSVKNTNNNKDDEDDISKINSKLKNCLYVFLIDSCILEMHKLRCELIWDIPIITFTIKAVIVCKCYIKYALPSSK